MNQENKKITQKVVIFFDKFEDVIRGHLSRYPVIYTLIGGIGIVLFWRGVWHTADILQEKGGWLEKIFYEPTSLVISLLILLATGLFVSYFIGDTILISGLKKEKKVAERTEREVKEEEAQLVELRTTVKDLKKEINEIKILVVEEHEEHHGHDKTKF